MVRKLPWKMPAWLVQAAARRPNTCPFCCSVEIEAGRMVLNGETPPTINIMVECHNPDCLKRWVEHCELTLQSVTLIWDGRKSNSSTCLNPSSEER